MRFAPEILLLAALLPAAACTSPRAAVSKRFLLPSAEWVAEPSDLGLGFEAFEIATGPDASVTGWFVPCAASDGRTVVLCHGNAANISFYHPYLAFLHDAGLHVVLFDYRGFGRSRGDVDVGALFDDTERVLDHVAARPDVDRGRIALFGISLGSIVALRVAADRPEIAAVLVEDVPSPRAAVREQLGALGAWFVETFALPEGVESADNAARVLQPSLFLCGERDPRLLDHLRAWSRARGPSACWVMPGTGHAPHGLMAQDGEYQRAITRFLDAALDGRAPRVEVTRLEGDAGALRVLLARRDEREEGALPVELCAVAADGRAAYVRRWLVHEREEWEMKLPFEPAWLSAHAYGRARFESGAATWEPDPGPLAGVEEALDALNALAGLVQSSTRPVEEARAFVQALLARDPPSPGADPLAPHGAFPPQLEAELVPAYLAAGKALLASDDASDRERGRALLQRCVAAAPARPKLHTWPATAYVAGFRHAAQVEEARRLLAAAATR